MEGPIRQLIDAKKAGKLENLMRHQHIEIAKVIEMLYKERSIANKEAFLKKSYPSLYLYVMQKSKNYLKFQKYKETCEDCKIGNSLNYSYYVHGKFLPWI